MNFAKPFSAVLLKRLFSFIFLSVVISTGLHAQGGGCTCTNCPQFMPDNFVGDFLINIQGATNNQLGQNGQGVCGVNITFDHEYLGDLSIVLTSPAGQSVTLVGPIGLFGGTDFTTWSVGFVPCGDPANPDPGFSAQWNNNQPWGTFGNYTGSYYPFAGCLENFNSGPVNGTWTLTVTDGQAVDVGNFINYEIIFCDPDGILCISCDANAGNLTQNDVTACEGSGNLNLNLPPTYTPPAVPPPASDYDYTYVIGGAGGVIQAYDPGPDLTGYPAGVYTVCGFSYLSQQSNLIPEPDGSLTITQLNQQLESSTPPLCGDISGNCVNVVINASPPDEEEYVTVCAPECYDFYNQSYCNSGTYVRNLQSPQGCTYTATLYLTVVQPVIRNISEVICEGECATTPGFESYCSAGNHQERFTSYTGCDSIVNLNLIVINPVAIIGPANNLTCTQTVVPLSGVGSSSGPGVTYLWTASNGGNITGSTNTINTLVNAAGDYQLRVCRTSGGITCCDSAQITVFSNQSPPDAPAAIAGPGNLCAGQTATYTATTVAGATSYIWTVPSGVTINSGQNTQSINITWNSINGGNICVTANNQCGPSAPTCLPVIISVGQAPQQPAGNAMVCSGATEAYSIPPVSGATNYTWTVNGGNLVSGQGTTGIVVDWATGNGSVCVNATTNCGISQDVCLPVTVTSIPVTPTPGGPLAVCPEDTSAYTLTAIPGATSYNWQVTNGVISSGQGNNAVQVIWNNGVQSGVVCANAANVCGVSQDSCLNISLSIPVAGIISIACDGANEFYTVTFPITGGTAPYTVSGGTVVNGVFTSGPIQSGQAYSFTILDTNQCAAAPISGSFNCACSTAAGNMSLLQLSACADQTVSAVFLGGENLDANDIGAYFLHDNAGGALGNIFGQNNTGIFGIQPGMAFETVYYISYVVGNNNNGSPDLQDPCLSVSQGQPVVFHDYPVANAGLDADTCGLSLQLNANIGIGIGSWMAVGTPPGATVIFTGTQNPLSGITVNQFGVYQLSWSLDNNGCVDTDTVSISFNDNPLINNVMHTCDAGNENYSLSFVVSGGTPGYNVNGTPLGALSGNTFVSSFIPNGAGYTYQAIDNEGCASLPLNGAFSCDCATGAGTMDVTVQSACEGNAVTATHLGGQTLDGNDVGGYFLHDLSGNTLGTVFAANNTGVFTFQPGMSYGTTYYVSFAVGNNLNGLPDTADFCLAVAPGQPVIFYQNPVITAGTDTETCGTILTLNATNITGGAGLWTVIAGNAGNLSVNQPNNPQSSVSSTQPGGYTLLWTVTQNGCVSSDQVDIQFNQIPLLSNLVRTCDAANENFTVTLTFSGGTAPYSINGTPSVGNTFTSPPFPNGQSYTFNVTDANGCAMPPITGAFSCNCATNAGTMPLITLSACEGNSITVSANNDQSLDGNDIVAYVLHDGAGPALGQILAQNTTGIFSLQAGMNFGQTYYVSLVAGNPAGTFPDPADPCFSVATGQPVVWLENPQPDAGDNEATCGLAIQLGAANTPFNGLWTQISGPGTANFLTPDNPVSGLIVTLPGQYQLLWTENNGACSGSDQVTIDFNEEPSVSSITETCNGTNTQYVISFTVTGGEAPFQAIGLAGTFSGNTFTSLPTANGSSYGFVVQDANGCTSPGISGSENCACSTDAGSMQVAPLVFCADAPAVAVWNNDGNTDADDIIRFVLHTNAGASLGTVLASSSTPSFNFSANLQTGVTYYISAIAGNNVGGNVSLSDPCLSIAPGTPVQWKPMPNATLSGATAICAGSTAILTLSGSGVFPLTLTYSDGVNANNLTVPNSQSISISVSPGATTTYTLSQVTDGTLPSCSTALNASVTITVSQPVDAGLANEPVELCQGAAINIVLSNLLTGAAPGGVWSQTNGPNTSGFNAAIGEFQTANAAAGNYQFQYLITAVSPCPNDAETVSVVLHPTPVADAGEDQAINCDQTSVTLGGFSTTSNANYSWIQNGIASGDAAQIIVDEAGIYTLSVTTDAGCTATDEVVVVLDNEPPVAEIVTVNGIRCNGENNGRITIDSVSAAHPPVLYSINGSPFQLSPIFDNLVAGNYTVTLMDENGCESTTAILNVDEPPLLTADLGADLSLELGDTARISVQTGVPFSALDTVIWAPLLDSTFNRNPLMQNFLPLRSWRIEVTVTDTNGCVARDEVALRLEKPRNIYVPNIFNPTSTLDPILYIFGGKDVSEIESFHIFDRWGTMLFEQTNFQPNDPAHGWDGTFKGEALVPAVFVYQAKVRFIDGVIILFKGDITLVR